MKPLKDLFKEVIDLYENAIKDDFFYPSHFIELDQDKQGNWIAPPEYQTTYIETKVKDWFVILETEFNKIDNSDKQIEFAENELKNIEKRIKGYTYYLPDNIATKDDELRSYPIRKLGLSRDERSHNFTLIEHLTPKQNWENVARRFYHIQTNSQTVFAHMIASIYFWITLKETIDSYTPMTKIEIDKLIDEFVQCLLQQDQLNALGIDYYETRVSELEEWLSPGSEWSSLHLLHWRLLTVLPQESEYQNFWVKSNRYDPDKIFKEVYKSLTTYDKNILYREFIYRDEKRKRMGVPIVYLAATAYRYLQQLQQIVNNGSLPQPINKQKPELLESLISFNSTETIENLFAELKGFFSGKENDLKKALNGEHLNELLFFPHNQNKFVEVFKRAKYNGFVLSTATEIKNWICSNFTYRKKKGNKTTVENFNTNTVWDILTKDKGQPTPKERICKPDWLPFKSYSQRQKELDKEKL